MQAKDLARFKDRLLKLRTRFANQVNSAEEALREDVVVRASCSNCPRIRPITPRKESTSRSRSPRTKSACSSDVEAALERIEAGTFGKCVDCGKPIGRERLEAIPYTPWCIECASEHSSELESPVLSRPHRDSSATSASATASSFVGGLRFVQLVARQRSITGSTRRLPRS